MAQRLRILAVGDELLLGKHVDTNSSTIARRLLDCGLIADRIRLVTDDEDALVAELAAAADGADLVIVTGGLGPTEDDRTRHALARAMGVPLQESAVAWRQVTRIIRSLRRGRPVATSNRRQALVPHGCRILRNDRGTAPGLLGRIGAAWVACLPGVPHEMRAMLERLVDRLPQLLPEIDRPTVAELAVAGIGESSLQDRLGDLAACRRPSVGITAHEAGHITIRLVGAPSSVKRLRGRVRRLLGSELLPAADLASSIVDHLASRQQTVAVAESCTCGQLVGMLGRIPGVSAVLRESHVTYHDEAKTTYCGVPSALLRRHGAVSRPVVEAMAVGLRERCGADLTLATSGIAGPGGGRPGKPVGTVWLAAADATGVVSRRIGIPGERARVQDRAAAQALLLGWELLSGRAAL